MPSRESSINDFGLLIAYVLPGFVALYGASYFSPALRSWIGTGPADAPTVGGFLFVTVASIAAGLTVSTVRWLVLDTLHHNTGIRLPAWDFSLLQQNIAAFDALIHIHYRYYQAHANLLISLVWTYLARRVSLGFWTLPLGWTDLGFAVLAVVLFLGSRDCLFKYYSRTGQLLREQQTHASRT